MIHHYLDDSNSSGDHYGVSSNTIRTPKVLVQLQERGEQVRVGLTVAQARHMAQKLLDEAQKVEEAQALKARP